jgi:molybdopterin molybdotransferase
VSTYGLDGVLPWAQARHVAATSGRAQAGVDARLDEAGGAILSSDLITIQDDPASDSAAVDGFAVRGEGPWILDTEVDVVTAGCAVAMQRGQSIPRHADSVIPVEMTVEEHRSDGRTVILARDPLTGVPDESARPELGSGIAEKGSISLAGHVLVPTGRSVGAAVLAIAAAAGHDEVRIVRPPVVGLLVLGGSLLDRGLPRNRRVRDALGPVIPTFVGALGARGNPAVRAPGTEELLRTEIDDASVDVLITTGSTAPGPDNHLRSVLRDLGARWLVDGASVTPGAQMLLAKLPDGRFLVGLPGDPLAAMGALITLVTPLLRTLRDDTVSPQRRSAVLMDDVPPADYADDTGLVPVRLEVSAAATQARALPSGGPAGLQGWATADAIAVIPPGAGLRGDVVGLLDLLGREDWPGWSE